MLSNNTNISIEYLYFVVKNIKIGKGYARHYSFLKEQLIVVPSNMIAEKFEKITQNLMEQITRNKKENQALAKQRDELLPLLMNGQVAVNSDLAYEGFISVLYFNSLETYFKCLILLLYLERVI